MESGTEFDLEGALARWRASHYTEAGIWPVELEELEANLRDRFDESISNGVPAEEAFRAAIAQMGDMGDLGELFRENRYADTIRGMSSRQIQRFLPALAVNYAKSASRSMSRTGLHTLISTFGLAVALACCIWILIFVGDELGYDTFHAGSDNIVRLAKGNSANTPERWAPEILASIAGVEDGVRIMNGAFQRVIFNTDNSAVSEPGGMFADASLFEVFSWSLAMGSKETALERPFSIVISPDMISRYNLPDNPLGSVIELSGVSNTAERRAYEITGVLDRPPGPSHIVFDYVLSFSSVELLNEQGEWGTPFSWVNRTSKSYFVLAPNADRAAITLQISELLRTFIPDERVRLDDLELQSLTSIHLESTKRSEFPGGGNLNYVYLLASLAFLVLILAMVNFVNLATARSSQRAKEVGMRKAIGASSSQIVTQYVTESVIGAFISLVLALGLAYWMQDFVVQMTLKELSLTSLLDPVFAGTVLLITLLTGLASGSYPAFVLSRYESVEAMKPSRSSSIKMSVMRKGLVVFQFAVSIGLIVTTLVMNNQMNFVENRELGYNPEDVLVVGFGHSVGLRDNIESIAARLRGDTRIEQVSASHSLPSGFLNTFSYIPEGKTAEEYVSLGSLALDAHLMSTLEIEIIAGRLFIPDAESDSMAYILNESGARALGWEPDASTIGKTVQWTMGRFGFTAPVIGIVKDFHYGSLRQNMQPIIFNLSRFGSSNLLVRVQSENAEPVLEELKAIWETYEPDFAFNYAWMNDRLASQYANERRLTKLFSYTAILALIIACLGLFSLASYATKRRVKEIGIRKTLGASSAEIVLSFSSEFALLLGIAVVVACPIAFMASERWLEAFAFRVPVGIGPFVTAIGIAFLIALLSVASQALKAATANPVHSLRSE